MYRFQASNQDARSDTECFATCFCWAMTMSPSSADMSLERRRVNAGEELAPYRAGYSNSGSNFNVLTPQNTLLDLVGDQWLLNCRCGGGRLQGSRCYKGRCCGGGALGGRKAGWARWGRQGDIVRRWVRWGQGASLHSAQDPGLDASQTAANESLDCALEARGGGGGRGGSLMAGAAPRARATGKTVSGGWGRAGPSQLADSRADL